MSQVLKNRCNFAVRCLLVLGNTSVEQNLRLKTLVYLLFIPGIFFLLFGCPVTNFWLLSSKQSHSLNIITFWTRAGMGGVGSLHLSERSVGFDHNAITPTLQKVLCIELNPVFLKCGNAPNTQNRYSLTLWWLLGLQNTSLDAKFRVQNFSFLLINQYHKVPGSTVSLNWGNAPNTLKGV